MTDPIDVAGMIERLRSSTAEWDLRMDRDLAHRVCQEAADALAALERENAALREDRERAVAEEREACAKEVEELNSFDEYDPGKSAAWAIRARGQR